MLINAVTVKMRPVFPCEGMRGRFPCNEEFHFIHLFMREIDDGTDPSICCCCCSSISFCVQKLFLFLTVPQKLM